MAATTTSQEWPEIGVLPWLLMERYLWSVTNGVLLIERY